MLNRITSWEPSALVSVKTSAMILRIFTALLLLYSHGFAKLAAIFSGNIPAAFDPIGIGVVLSFTLAAFAEGICSLFIIVGFWTRWAALIIIINMAVASFVTIPGRSFAQHELAIFYLMAFGVVFLMGPGDHSIDRTRQLDE